MSLMVGNRRNSERGRGQGRSLHARGPGVSFRGGRMTWAPSRGPLRVNARPSSYAIAKPFRRTKSVPWQPDLFEDSLRAVGLTGVQNGTKLYVSNLDSGVTNDDIRELFSEMGQLTRFAVHYDKNGRSSGSAEVVFARRSAALQAMKRYNDVLLDGRPMKIEIVGTNSEVPISARVNVVGGVNGRRTVVMTTGGRGRSSSSSVNRGSGQKSRANSRNVRGRSRGRGGGRGRKKAMGKSAEELDKELDNYHTGAMQT